MNTVFAPAELLLPRGNLENWAVIACDQFTSQPKYWEEVKALVGESPSALKLIVPEAWLGEVEEEKESAAIAGRMEDYLEGGVFQRFPASYVYLEREMLDGSFRQGLVGAVDLEQYDFTPGTAAPVRATEETILSRLPARMAVRAKAPLELPHIMLLTDVGDDGPFRLARSLRGERPDYDFALMQGGGRIRGWVLDGERAEEIASLFRAEEGELRLVIGDGNHSLAAARQHWLRLREGLNPRERETHPARWCLSEVCWVGDPAIRFHPIHRVLFNCDPEKVSDALRRKLDSGEGLALRIAYQGAELSVPTAYRDAGSLTRAVQELVDALVKEGAATVDYVHGEADARELGSAPGNLALLLPPLGRKELFEAARQGRIFPRKCFSIGEAREKRYYLEAREIR